jgi:Bacterial Ig-like domain (group 1)/Carboxypeptidase regulatory-like domain
MPGPLGRCLALSLSVALAVSGCGGEDAGCNGPFCQSPPVRPEASSLQPGQNNGQQGAPSRELPKPIDVMVTDSGGHPVSGVTVSFSVSGGGGTLSSSTAQSDVNGLASVSWTLGSQLGNQSLRAEASNEDGKPLNNSPLELSAMAVQPQPAGLVLLTTLAETAQNGVVLVNQPVVQVFDADSQPLSQVEVVASVGSGGATLSGTATATSDASGQAIFTDLALVGPQGPQTLKFSVTTPALEITSSPIQLLAGTAASLTGVEPLSYQGTVNSPVAPGPSVIAKDAAGNPVAGVSVTFASNRDASVSPETAVTNEQGLAQVSWTLGSTANVQYSLTARVESSSLPAVRFSATAQAGAAGRLTVAVQPSSPTQSGTPFAQQPAIQVADQNGNPAAQAGVTVTATISSGPSGSLQNSTAVTDASGRAAFTGLTLTGGVGGYTLSFSAPGLTGVTSAPFSITVGGAARLAFTTVPSTLARSRSPLVIQPVVQVQDASGNPITQAGTVVTATLSAASTSLSGETATTDADGRALFSGLTITGIPGPKDLTFSAPGLQSITARVTLPSVQTVSAAPNHPVSATVGTTVGGPVIAWTFKDAATRPVPDADFTFRLPSGGTAATLTPLSDANGVVQVGDWTLGTTAGYQYLELTLPDHRVFRDSILATPGAVVDLVKFSGDSQSAPINSELPQALVVKAVDQFGNGVANVTVQWATCDGVAGEPVPPTDANGFSSTRQPTGSQSSGDQFFCTSATATIGASTKVVQFHYQVTDASTQGTGVTSSGSVSRHSGPPPIAP